MWWILSQFEIQIFLLLPLYYLLVEVYNVRLRMRMLCLITFCVYLTVFMSGDCYFFKEISQIIIKVSKEYQRHVFSTEKRQKSYHAGNNKIICRSVLLLTFVSTDPHQLQGATLNLHESTIVFTCLLSGYTYD